MLVTLCIRCHIRIHHSSGLRYWVSQMLVRLWRELHAKTPMQLQLTFGNTEIEENSKGVVDDAPKQLLSLFTLPSSHAPKPIGALGDMGGKKGGERVEWNHSPRLWK
jgi:hypothetical protein